MLSYVILLVVALLLNCRDNKMLALTVVVGAGIFSPVPDSYFYLICVLGEALIGLIAYRLAAPASTVIVRTSSLLVMFHALGYLLDGYPPTSPYHLLVKISEHAELLACIVLSSTLTRKNFHG